MRLMMSKQGRGRASCCPEAATVRQILLSTVYDKYANIGLPIRKRIAHPGSLAA